MKELKLKSFDGLVLQCYAWDEVKKPKGVVQIIHGMKEHANRYTLFAKKLNEFGYIVFGHDLRGHGKTAQDVSKLGVSEGDIFNECVHDAINVSEFIKNTYLNLPIYVFAHSFGSFVGQKYIQVCDIPEKIVLCGTAFGGDVLYKLARIVAFFTGLKGKHVPAKMIENMSFKNYEKNFENGNWLTRDNSIFEAYGKDEFCGTVFPASFYKSMFKNLSKLNKGIKDISENLKIMLIVGDQDKVSNNGKGVRKLFYKYKDNKKHVKIKTYKDARHELINETNKEEVIQDIVDFFNKQD